jgi:hypothetical protein
MRKLTFFSILFAALGSNAFAQHTTPVNEKYGNTLNLGVGLGYYGYVGHAVRVFHADYKIDILRNFTLAPFIAYYTYQEYNYWGDPHYQFKNYYYRETVVPVGIKGSYYFDQLLHANPKWDFYAAGSLGFAIKSTTWENGYYGDKTVTHGTSDLFLDLHIGAEYHLSKKAGLFLDLSTGVSTFGLAIHF